MMSKARELANLGGVDGALSNRNRIINGSFTVSQRGSFSVAATYPSASYWADRWIYDTNNANSLISLVDVNIPALAEKTKAARLVAGTTATTYLGTRQRLEFPEKYAGKTYTYSAWVRSNNANARLTGYFVGPNQVIASAPHSGGGGWEQLSVTFTFSSTEASTAYFDAFIASASIGGVQIASGDYIEITGVQLEVGDTTTPFEHRSYGQELALCQRYFQVLETGRLMSVGNGSGYSIGSTVLPVSLRAAASINYVYANGSNFAGYSGMSGAQIAYTCTGFASEAENFQFRYNLTNTNDVYVYWHDLGSGTGGLIVKLDAEL